LKKANTLGGILEGANWDLFEAIGKLTDERLHTAHQIRGAVEHALQSDEHVLELGPALKAAQAKAVGLLTESTKSPEPPPQPRDAKPTPKPGRRIVSHGAKENLGVAAAKDMLISLEREQQQGRSIHVSLSWTIEEDGTKQ
jgi:hypothetical protein